MSLFLPENATPVDEKQNRLMQFAALFLLAYSVILSLAPAVRLHSWEVSFRWNHWIGFVVWIVGTALVSRVLARFAPERDPFLFPIAALLAGWGMLSIWRLDAVNGARQTVWLAVALALLAGGLRVPNLLVLLRRYKYLWLTSGLLLTALTFLFGTYPGGVGPRLWLGCCGVYLQPSEPLKLLLIIYLAAYLADRLPISFGLVHLLAPTLVLAGAALALLVRQRDLGTASLFILIYTVVVYLASQKKRVLLISLSSLVIAGLIGYLLFDVVRIRVEAWLNPWLAPAGRSYQIVQSLMAVAAGGLLGTGPGLGSPGVVPVAHSDFIFASIAEESGLLGAAGLLLLFGLLMARGFRAALYASSNYRRYLAAGIAAYLAIQAIFITGGNLRLLPLTGVTLPFVSYGGSSLLTSFIAVLLLILVSNLGEEETAPLTSTTPYLLISGGLLVGLLALALVTGWWSIVRSSALQARADNPRRSVADRFVQRGSLLDRSGTPISRSEGVPGEYRRVYEYPPLSGTTGYNNPVFGQTGLEAGLDDYLRGLEGTPEEEVWGNNLLYGQPPLGLNVRLTIDLALQRQADLLLQGHRGALVLLNASNGEILALASHPYFDPQNLEEQWNALIQNPGSPLLNRATQGQYLPGAALGPFLLGYAAARDEVPALTGQTTYTTETGSWECALEPEKVEPGSTQNTRIQAFGRLIAAGCPAPLAAIGDELGAEALDQLFASLGFYEQPDLPLPVAPPVRQPLSRTDLSAIGQERLQVTPLQMALASAALTNNGSRLSPQIANAVLTRDQGWKLLTNEEDSQTLLAGGASAAIEALQTGEAAFWTTTALARAGDQTLTWFLAGSTPNWQGTPLALAIVIEEENPSLASTIGLSLLEEAGQ